MSKLDLKKDKSIKKENYINEKMNEKQKENALLEYKFDKNTDLIPKKRNKLIIIMLSEDKGISFINRKFNKEWGTFRYNKGKYIIEKDSIHISRNGCRICIYIEGISLPLKSSYVEKILKKVTYTTITGEEKTETIQTIKGLKFDAKIFDTFSNREFAEIFTKPPVKTFEYMILIFSIVSLVIGCIDAGLIYYFR